MRKFNPIYLAAAVAIALSGPAALAQTTGGTLRVAPGGTATTPGTTATATSAASTTTGTTPTPGVSAEPIGGGQSLRETPSQFNASSGSAMGTNQTTVDPATTRPGSFEPGGPFGPPGSSVQGTTTVPTQNGTNSAVLIPGDTGFGNPSQQNIVIQQQPAAQPERALATPLLDQTTREAQARETRRRNAKQEPRIIGIAPNTDRDLTYQMPDDRIIRY